jgi:two-component system, LuxR family, response regulator FixJ
MSSPPTVFVIDPDREVSASIAAVAAKMDLRSEVHANGEEFLAAFDRNQPGCVICEIRVPGANGLQIQQRLTEIHATQPVIFLTTAASVSIAVHAMRAGALHFLEKPFHEHDAWSAIQEAIQLDQRLRQTSSRHEEIQTKLKALSEKEFAVLELLAECKSKGAMAEDLGVSVRTIEHHRTQLMRKLRINSIPGLLHFALSAKPSTGCFNEKIPAPNHAGNGFAAHGVDFHFRNGNQNHRRLEAPAQRRSAK